MITNLSALLFAALALMGSPGPATLSLAAMGAAFGAKGGLRYLFGIIVGTTGVLLLIASGVTAAVLAIPALSRVIVLVAAVYILYLAWRIATAPPLDRSRPAVRAPSFPSGFFLAIANPKAFAAIGAVYSGNVLAEGDLVADGLLKIAILTGMIVAINSVWLVFGSMVSALLHDPRQARAANIAFAVLLLISVALAVL
jgi:threonine/homoserine/homoserine lactone efflux protein